MLTEHEIAHFMAIPDHPRSKKPKNSSDKHNVPG